MTDSDNAGSPDNAPHPKVAVLGSYILDVLGRPVPDIPAGQASIPIEQIRMTAAGTAGGTVVDLAALGAQTLALGAVGEDLVGDFLLNVLSSHDVDVSAMVRIGADQTAASILPIRPNGERPALHVRGVNVLLRLADLQLPDWSSIDGLHLGGPDIMQAMPTGELQQMLQEARGAGVFVTMDVQSGDPTRLRRDLPDLYPYADVLMPNIEQGTLMTGREDPDGIIGVLLEQGAQAVAITTGEDGVVYGDGKVRYTQDAFPTDVKDTTGCGDSFSAAFLFAMLCQQSVPQALASASLAASLTAAGLGSDAGLISWPELQSLLASHDS